MANASSKVSSDAHAPRRMARPLDRHDQALLAAEVRRLVHELRTSGPLSKRRLGQRCHAGDWRDGTLDAAIREGIRQGRLRQLPFGWVDVPRDRPARADAN